MVRGFKVVPIQGVGVGVANGWHWKGVELAQGAFDSLSKLFFVFVKSIFAFVKSFLFLNFCFKKHDSQNPHRTSFLFLLLGFNA